MNDITTIRQIAEKLVLLLHQVEKNGSQFSVLEKDLFDSYVHQLTQWVSRLPTSVVTSPMTATQAATPAVTDGPAANGIEGVRMASEAAAPARNNGAAYVGSATETQPLAKETLTLNEKLKKQGTELIDRLRLSPISDLKSFIGLNKRFAFVGSLFNDDEKLYEQSIDALNQCSDYNHALGVLQDLQQRFNWKDDDEWFREFSLLVYRRYQSK